MAPWHELVLACNLKEDIPQQVVDMLHYLISPPFNEQTRELEPMPTPDHYFFREWEWQFFFGGHCYYFPGIPVSNLTQDNILNAYTLTVRTMIRRESQKIAAFLDWIAPYSQSSGFVGYTRCDEVEEIHLIYFEDGEVYYNTAEFWKEPHALSRRKISKDETSSSDIE